MESIRELRTAGGGVWLARGSESERDGRVRTGHAGRVCVPAFPARLVLRGLPPLAVRVRLGVCKRKQSVRADLGITSNWRIACELTVHRVVMIALDVPVHRGRGLADALDVLVGAPVCEHVAEERGRRAGADLDEHEEQDHAHPDPGVLLLGVAHPRGSVVRTRRTRRVTRRTRRSRSVAGAGVGVAVNLVVRQHQDHRRGKRALQEHRQDHVDGACARRRRDDRRADGLRPNNALELLGLRRPALRRALDLGIAAAPNGAPPSQWPLDRYRRERIDPDQRTASRVGRDNDEDRRPGPAPLYAVCHLG